MLGTEIPVWREVTERSIELFHEAMGALEGATEYQEALSLGVVPLESPVEVFLRHADCDPWAAARQMGLYWKTRKQVFGPERAFLPMTLDGAMADDVQHMRKGFLCAVEDDAHGRPVLYYNRIRATREIVPREAACRCWFYMLHVLSLKEETQRSGLVVLQNYQVRRFLCKLYSRCTLPRGTSHPPAGLRFVQTLRQNHVEEEPQHVQQHSCPM